MNLEDVNEELESHDEFVAKNFHRIYEELAPHFGYKTRNASAVPLEDVPKENKALMIAVVHRLFKEGILH